VSREKERSVSQSRGGFTVASSPFNSVKVELGVILVLAVVLFLWHERLSQDADVQMGMLAGFGVLSALWLVVRVKKIEKSMAEQRGEEKTQ